MTDILHLLYATVMIVGCGGIAYMWLGEQRRSPLHTNTLDALAEINHKIANLRTVPHDSQEMWNLLMDRTYLNELARAYEAGR